MRSRGIRAGRLREPAVVGHVKGLALGRRRGPRIVVSGSQAVIVALSHQTGDVLAWRSADGEAWSGPATVNDVPKTAVEGLHALASNGNGGVYCVWLDLRNKKMEIAGAASTDSGATWGTNRLIYHSPSGSVCECCHPSAVFDSSGRLLVMWRNSLAGNRDMYLASSADMGETFSTAVKLGTGTWPLNACPMDGGALAPAANGSATTVWRRDREVFRSISGQPEEQSLGIGEQPWAAATGEGAYLTWVSRRGGDLWLLRRRTARPSSLPPTHRTRRLPHRRRAWGPSWPCGNRATGRTSPSGPRCWVQPRASAAHGKRIPRLAPSLAAARSAVADRTGGRCGAACVWPQARSAWSRSI